MITEELTAENIHTHLLKLHESGQSIKAKDVNKHIHEQGLEIHGTWENVLSSIGLTWEDVYGRKENGYWTKERVDSKMQERYKEGKGLSYLDLRNDDVKLYYGVMTVYATIDSAIEAIGLDPMDYVGQTPKDYWTRDRLMSELWKRKSKGESLKPTDLRNFSVTLIDAIKEEFDTWDNMYEMLGVDPSEHLGRRQNRQWSAETVMEGLQERRALAESVSATDVHREDISLYRQGLKYYGTWKDVLDAFEKIL